MIAQARASLRAPFGQGRAVGPRWGQAYSTAAMPAAQTSACIGVECLGRAHAIAPTAMAATGTHRVEALPAEAHGDGAHRVHVHPPGVAAQPPDLLDDARGVGDRRRVRHRVDGGVAAEGGRPRAARHGLGVLPAGLAQVRVRVDEARQRDEALGVDGDGVPAGLAAGRRADGADDAAVEQEVRGAAAERGGAAQEVGGHEAPPGLGTAGASEPARRR